MSLVSMLLTQAGHICGDDMDLIDGKLTGSIRISFGYMSTLDDVETFLKFVHECFVDNPPVSVTSADEEDVFYDALEENTVGGDDDTHEKPTNHEVADESTAGDEGISSGQEMQMMTAVSKLDQPHHLGQLQFQHLPELTEDGAIESDNMTLTQIFLYPVKSCGAFQVSEGLLFFCLV